MNKWTTRSKFDPAKVLAVLIDEDSELREGMNRKAKASSVQDNLRYIRNTYRALVMEDGVDERLYWACVKRAAMTNQGIYLPRFRGWLRNISTLKPYRSTFSRKKDYRAAYNAE